MQSMPGIQLPFLLIWHLSRFVVRGNSITAAFCHRYICIISKVPLPPPRYALLSTKQKSVCESHYRNVFMNQKLAVNAGCSGSISIARYDTSSKLAYFIIRHRYPFPVSISLACRVSEFNMANALQAANTKKQQQQQQNTIRNTNNFSSVTLYSPQIMGGGADSGVSELELG